MENRQLCPKCGGIGVVYHVEKITDGYRGEVDTCPVCRGTGSVPVAITNADRIRSMSDEELAEFISRIEIGDFGQQVYGKTFCDMCKGQYECDDCRLWWLQRPAEEDT